MEECRNEDAIELNQAEGSERKKSNKKDEGPAQNFPDIEEFDGNLYKSVGIKRMKGYKCYLPINQLNEWSEKFWMTRNEDENLRIIQQIMNLR